MCKERFINDKTKSFLLYDPFCFVDNRGIFYADLALSLDIIYHLIEDDIYDLYMKHLFKSAKRNVIIYSSNFDSNTEFMHVKNRHFSKWVSSNLPNWIVTNKISNRYPYDKNNPENTSESDFFIFKKT